MPDEVPQGGLAPATAGGGALLTDYMGFMGGLVSQLVESGKAYSNKRVQLNPRQRYDGAKTANKVVLTALFIPAHPSRFRVLGPGRGKKFEYFVVHRPGRVKKPGDEGYNFRSKKEAIDYATRACRTDNIVREFRQLNRPASTQFIIG